MFELIAYQYYERFPCKLLHQFYQTKTNTNNVKQSKTSHK